MFTKLYYIQLIVEAYNCNMRLVSMECCITRAKNMEKKPKSKIHWKSDEYTTLRNFM